MNTEGHITVGKNSSTSRIVRIVLGLALLAPAGLCCITGLVVPTVQTIITSLQKAGLPGRGTEFVGLANYTNLFEDPRFSAALSFTLLLIVVRVLVVAVVPLLLAFVVNEFGRAVRIPVRLLFTVPLALFAPVSTAIVWAMALNPQFGLVNVILHSLGRDPQRWLVGPEQARRALLFTDGLVTFGLACGMGLIFYLAALRGSGEKAPSGKKAFVPLLASWVTGLLATIALSLPSFTLSYVATGGGPAGSTTTLGLYQFTTAFQRFNFGVGATVATLILVVAALLGLIVGLIVVFAGLRLEMVPWGKRSGLLSGEGKPGRGKPVAIVLLALTLLVSLGLCSLSGLPMLWNALNSLKTQAEVLSSPPSLFPSSPSLDAYSALGKVVPVGRAFVNTIAPPLIGLLLRLLVVYLGALGIGAARPFGKRSELLLLPFSPWLFVTISSLSIVAYRGLADAGRLDTFSALSPPIILSVPMLFILTLFFKGQEPKWRAVQAEGRSAVSAFFTRVILPSLPLVALLACASLLVDMQDMLWPLLAVSSPQNYTINLALLSLYLQMGRALPTVAAAVTLFGLPTFVFFFLAFGVLQSFYMDRLALATHPSDTESE
jgi:ABC-type sugar transport system permease subunit/ABC-type maltose transport system permease subunit